MHEASKLMRAVNSRLEVRTFYLLDAHSESSSSGLSLAAQLQLYHIWSLMHEGVKIWGNELRWLQTVKEPQPHIFVIMYFSSCSTCFPESELFCILFSLFLLLFYYYRWITYVCLIPFTDALHTDQGFLHNYPHWDISFPHHILTGRIWSCTVWFNATAVIRPQICSPLQLEELCCHRGVNITSTPQDLVLLTCHTSKHPLTAPEVLPGKLLG